MALVMKDTIKREAFEKEMEIIKRMLKEDVDKYSIMMAVNRAMERLTEYTDKEKEEDPFQIPDWINQDVTVTVQVNQMGDFDDAWE